MKLSILIGDCVNLRFKLGHNHGTNKTELTQGEPAVTCFTGEDEVETFFD